MVTHPPENKKLSAASLFYSNLTKGFLTDVFEKFIDEKASAGRDGTRVEAFKNQLNTEIDLSIRKILNSTYEFTSYKEKLISKGAGKIPRQISIPTVRDKLILKFLSELLAKIYPNHVSKPPHQIIKQIHNISSSSPSNNCYLRLDIENYYPSIDHKILMRILRRKIRQKALLRLIECAIKTPTGVKKSANTLVSVGIPQGLSISNILASLYLEDIDNKYSGNTGLSYFRFVDDILIVCTDISAQMLSVELPALIKSKRKLRCHAVGKKGGKSILLPISDGIDYLGYHFCGNSIEVRSSSFKKMISGLMNVFTSMKYRGNKAPLIWRLNLRISGCKYQERRIGWLFFFSQSENIQQIKQLDRFTRKQAEKVLNSDQQQRIKSFTKAYHEIKYNHRDSTYFPNFDNFDDEQMRQQIRILLPGKKIDDLNAMDSKELSKLFNKCISREVSNLEKDMLEVFS